MKQQIAFPLVLSITILLLLGGMLYAILAAPTQSSKKLAMTSKHQPTPKITATAANKASAEPTMPNDTPAPQTKITKKYIRIQATDSSLWKYNRKTHTPETEAPTVSLLQLLMQTHKWIRMMDSDITLEVFR